MSINILYLFIFKFWNRHIFYPLRRFQGDESNIQHVSQLLLIVNISNVFLRISDARERLS